MRIALIGYGKMGKMIEELAVERGHTISLKIHIDNTADFTAEKMKDTDVAIEFTAPESAFENVTRCLQFGVPVISGSTGWNDRLPEAKAICQTIGGTFLHASNFSIGVNIFFALNTRLAQLMAEQPAYNVSLKEIHHTQKRDAPSGTAVTLAEQIIEAVPGKQAWTLEKVTTQDKIIIEAERTDPAPGTHHVKWSSEIDDIEIIHTAHSRKGFALGAVLAAEFIQDKKGVFTMQDVLSL